MKARIFTIFGICISVFLFAGNTKELSYNQLVKKANDYCSFGEYEKALPLYLKADSMQSGVATVDYGIGICYVYSIHHERSLPYLEKAYKEGFQTAKKPTMEKFWESLFQKQQQNMFKLQSKFR